MGNVVHVAIERRKLRWKGSSGFPSDQLVDLNIAAQGCAESFDELPVDERRVDYRCGFVSKDT